MIEKANFNAGPAILPESVEKKLRQATFDFEGTGLPVWSVSHRDWSVENICQKNITLAEELLAVPDGYTTLFLPRSATDQFKDWILNLPCAYDVPLIGYIDSGHWSSKSIDAARELEAGGHCKVYVLASSKDGGYHFVPTKMKEPSYEGELDFLYLTTNETANSIRMPLSDTTWPYSDISGVRVADMTSDIMSRPFNVSEFGLIFAGAQKNLGVTGTTLVIIRDDLIGEGHCTLSGPSCYAKQNKHYGALYNTPNVLSLVSVYYMLEWIKEMGGVAEMEKRAHERASKLYNVIDESDVFEGVVNPEDRSVMNILFRLRDQSQHNLFLKRAKKAGIEGIEGHRGSNKYYGSHFRASNYNGQTMENIDKLIDVMQTFEKSV
jgi:phosphoserine aminotransferase